MSSEALCLISEAMNVTGLEYGFMEYATDAGNTLPKTYFVGEYQELEGEKESGETDSIFILTGFSRKSWAELEHAKEKIRKYLSGSVGRIYKTESGLVVAVFYENSFPIHVEDDELKKMQINLLIKEWKAET